MKHLLLISHGEFAKGMLDSIRIIAGAQENVEALCIQEDTSSEDFKLELKKKCCAYGDSQIVIISDIAGGSTTQCALTLLEEFENVSLVCGLNLGLVLELLFVPLTDAKAMNQERINEIIQSNRRSICLVEENQASENDMESDEL